MEDNQKPILSKKFLTDLSIVLVILVFVGIWLFVTNNKKASINIVNNNSSISPINFQSNLTNVSFSNQTININPEIAKSFPLSEIKNIPDMEKAYGFTFTPDDLVKLEKNKFIIKNILDTNLSGPNSLSVSNNNREMVALYGEVVGSSDYKARTQANSVFISADSMMNLFSILSADLLKETENNYLFDQTFSMTKVLYNEASNRLQLAKTNEKRNQWTKVRDYFSIPYALFSNVMKPVTAGDYWNSDEYRSKGLSIEEVQVDYLNKDKNVDSYANAETFIKNLNLGNDSEQSVLADLEQVYDASEPKGIPKIFSKEISALPPKIEVKIPFTLFKPRGTYTSSSLRRQYFRAVQWYQQIPFLLASKDLTSYAVDIGEIVKGKEDIQNQYKTLSSFIAYVVGESDDLDLSDYVAAVGDLGLNDSHNQKILADYLDKRKPAAKIKAMPVNIDPLVGITVADEIKAISGMRFMSQKFIPDSYWTSKLTQGDEAPEVNGLSLPDKASSLEVMSILGSPYATSHLSDLPFYQEKKQAVDTRLSELTKEANGWGDNYWQSNLYTGSLWTVSGLFSWLETNRVTLPQFMQSPQWSAKTLLTSAGFWTELRHTSILYAKQSMAEKGGGGGDGDPCDLRKVPEPAKGYVEPQAEAYDRLYYTAKRLAAEYNVRGYKLNNLPELENYIKLLDTVRKYTKLELENNILNEVVVSQNRHSTSDNKDCTEYFLSTTTPSQWEELRLTLVRQMAESLPLPVEGPIMQIKDKREAVVADIHTDKNGGILEEGTGVPRIIFVAVKDVNGPRLTVGFTYSQYESISGIRLTDEDWQNNFYTDSGSDYSISYKPKSVWPDINPWFQELLGKK
ncbi:MAG: DUF3160 domain-containing protein [bacterium]